MPQHKLLSDSQQFQLSIETNTIKVNHAMNNVPMKVYQGHPTEIDFSVRNRDRKKVSLLDKDLRIQIISAETGELVIDRLLDAVDKSIGRVKLMLSASDTQDLKIGWYKFIVVYDAGDGSSGVLYSDWAFDSVGTLEVTGIATPQSAQTITLDTFTYDSSIDKMYSQYGVGSAQFGYTGTQHSYVVYPEAGFSGTVTLEGTLEAVPSDDSRIWFTIDEKVLDTQTDLSYNSYTINPMWVRATYKSTNSKTISKVLVRN